MSAWTMMLCCSLLYFFSLLRTGPTSLRSLPDGCLYSDWSDPSQRRGVRFTSCCHASSLSPQRHSSTEHQMPLVSLWHKSSLYAWKGSIIERPNVIKARNVPSRELCLCWAVSLYKREASSNILWSSDFLSDVEMTRLAWWGPGVTRTGGGWRAAPAGLGGGSCWLSDYLILISSLPSPPHFTARRSPASVLLYIHRQAD